MRNRIIHDRITRVITVQMYDWNSDQVESAAHELADQRLRDDGTLAQWHFARVEQINYDRINVIYVA